MNQRNPFLSNESENPFLEEEIISTSKDQLSHSSKSFWDHYQDLMQPKKYDREGKPMIETLIGRLPEKIPEFESGSTEHKNFVKGMINANAVMPGIKTVVQTPFNLTLGNIAKKIIEQKNKEKLFHTTQYNRLWDLANKAGINNIKFNPNEINIEALTSSGANKKYIRPLQKFIENPTLENAQIAQSDLGKLINSPQLSKGVLTSEENAVKNAAEKAQKHIRDMMFRNEKGEVNQALKSMYDKITASYEKNMIPYKNSSISKYEKGKMTAKQLISKLKSGEFIATKGKAHPEIEQRDMANQIAKYFGIPTGVGLGFTGGSYLLKKLIDRD